MKFKFFLLCFILFFIVGYHKTAPDTILCRFGYKGGCGKEMNLIRQDGKFAEYRCPWCGAHSFINADVYSEDDPHGIDYKYEGEKRGPEYYKDDK